jgi:two-component system NarL family sensor kinase
MDPERRRTAVERGHIGLASSVERVEALGGDLEFDSRPGEGTRIRTTLPVKGGQ